MKKTLIILFTCILFSCSNDDYVVGLGINPELNYEEYTFTKAEGKVDIYSKLGYSLQIYFSPTTDEDGSLPVVTEYPGGRFKSVEGGWYTVTADFDAKKFTIEVKANETGKERRVPISFMNGDYGCRVKYVQSK